MVKFPSKHRARLVVDLTKLNVPCKRGRFEVSGHQPVCGKLEDLHESSRHYVLDAGRQWSATFVGRFVFSLSYRLAAGCYDNDVAQQNGTIVFTPGSECRYKVTQPYGYRLRLLIDSVPYGHPTRPPVDVYEDDGDDRASTTSKPITVSRYFYRMPYETCLD